MSLEVLRENGGKVGIYGRNTGREQGAGNREQKAKIV
jgi:hypothetical protein